MDKSLLFAVPIYVSNEETFEHKWDAKIEAAGESGGSVEKGAVLERFPWKYNQIVGVVEIFADVRNRDVVFEVYKRQGNASYYYISRNGLVPLDIYYNHFKVVPQDSNESIRDRIIASLKRVVREEFGGRFLDLELFKSQMGLMDVRRVFGR